MKKGLFITFEGGEGSGKSTQIKLLAEYLASKGCGVFTTREPGGEAVAEQIREVILKPGNKVNAISELLLFEAARSQFTSEIVLPRLKKGQIVLSDRYYDSSVAYQGYARGIELDIINYLNRFASNGLKPDLTYVFDISAKLGLSKSTKNEFGKMDRIEAEGINFHKKVNDGFLKIAKKEPHRVKIIPYIENGIDKMQQMIRKYADELLEKH